MSQQQMDKKWQEMEVRIHKLVDHFMQGEILAIEHKPRHIALLQMPAGYSREEKRQAVS